VGSCVPTRIDEAFEEKRFIVFDSTDGSVQSYSTLYRRYIERKFLSIEDMEGINYSELEEILANNNKLLIKTALPPTGKLRDFLYKYSRDGLVYLSYYMKNVMDVEDNNGAQTLGGITTDLRSDIENFSIGSALLEYCQQQVRGDETLMSICRDVVKTLPLTKVS